MQRTITLAAALLLLLGLLPGVAAAQTPVEVSGQVGPTITADFTGVAASVAFGQMAPGVKATATGGAIGLSANVQTEAVAFGGTAQAPGTWRMALYDPTISGGPFVRTNGTGTSQPTEAHRMVNPLAVTFDGASTLTTGLTGDPYPTGSGGYRTKFAAGTRSIPVQWSVTPDTADPATTGANRRYFANATLLVRAATA